MNYCLFDGGDVVGPFSAQTLLLRPGFGAHCLVCPEEHSEDEAFWKEAHCYEEFGFAEPEPPQPQVPQPPQPPQTEFLEEMNHAVEELDSFTVNDKAPSPVPVREERATPPQPPAVSPRPDATASAPHQEEKVKISSILMQASDDMKQRSSDHAEKPAQEISADTAVIPLVDDGPGAALSAAEEPAGHKDPSETQSVSLASAGAEVVERTIGKMSPIEEYFDTIKSGDLGRILGIPDPKENSDMNLARALESQFEKTDPGTGRLMDEDPFDEFTPKEKNSNEEQNLLLEVMPPETDKKTEETLSRSLPDLKDAEALPLADQSRQHAAKEDLESLSDEVQELTVTEQTDDDPNDQTVKTILEGRLKVDTLRQEIPEPIKEVSAEKKPQNSSAAVEMAREQEWQHKEKVQYSGRWKYLFLMFGALVLLTGAYLNWKRYTVVPDHGEEAEILSAAPAPSSSVVPDARTALHVYADAQPEPDPLLLAQEIVQNYQLDRGRGTVEEYLNKLYSKQLQEGYAAVWSAEPLHRDSYVVKYRLAKTRKEPIVYIFQADTAKKKLTGALNNITLDLVGKIS